MIRFDHGVIAGQPFQKLQAGPGGIQPDIDQGQVGEIGGDEGLEILFPAGRAQDLEFGGLGEEGLHGMGQVDVVLDHGQGDAVLFDCFSHALHYTFV